MGKQQYHFVSMAEAKKLKKGDIIFIGLRNGTSLTYQKAVVLTFLLNAYVFYVRFMQRKENCSKQIVVLVINYKRKTYRSFDNPTPTYFFFPLYQFKTRKREYKIQSKLGRRIKPEKGEYIEIFVNPKNPTELYEPADNFSSEDYINSEWVTIKNLAIGGTLLMLTGWTLICFIL